MAKFWTIIFLNRFLKNSLQNIIKNTIKKKTSLETKSSRPRPKSFETETRPETFETRPRLQKTGLATRLETPSLIITYIIDKMSYQAEWNGFVGWIYIWPSGHLGKTKRPLAFVNASYVLISI